MSARSVYNRKDAQGDCSQRVFYKLIVAIQEFFLKDSEENRLFGRQRMAFLAEKPRFREDAERDFCWEMKNFPLGI